MISQSRRTFLKRLSLLPAAGVLGAGGSYGYGTLLERHQLKVEQHHVPLALGEKAPVAFRAVMLTDLHFDPLYEEDFLAECVRRVNALQPDLVLMTGDYITSTTKRVEDFARVMGRLEARSGVFACLGNHDQWAGMAGRVAGALQREHLEVLQNQHTRLSCKGGEVVISGLQSAWGGVPDWAATSKGLTQKDRVLMLMHEPDYAHALKQDPRIVLQMSGHTHGGQVRVPGYGALILPKWGKAFQAGFYDVGQNLKLYVNRGIGTIDHHVRFFCPPEIACFDVVNTDAV